MCLHIDGIWAGLGMLHGLQRQHSSHPEAAISCCGDGMDSGLASEPLSCLSDPYRRIFLRVDCEGNDEETW